MKRTSGQNRAETRGWRTATRAVRGGTYRSEIGETSEAIFLTSGYCYDNAEEAAARFRGERPGMTYSRLQNPSVQMFEERLALLEGAEACRASSSGMAAISAALMATLSAGDHVVAARQAFGACRAVVENILPRFGIESTIVDACDLSAWEEAMRPGKTKLVLFETPANPTLDIVDIRAVSGIAHRHGALVMVDNAFTSPVTQRPLELGADIVAYSATKLIDGQGRVLAGAVLGSREWVEGTYLDFTRQTGPLLSPFNAWLLLKSLETLELRVARQAENAQVVAEFLAERVPTLYPGLAGHPGHALARTQMATGGTIISFTVEGGRKGAHAVLDHLKLIDISNNVGDSRTLMTHPASSTHSGMTPEAQREMGITEGMLRLSVGLEDSADLLEDIAQALRYAGA